MDSNLIFTRKTLVDATHVDRWGRMRPASLLEVMQETAGDHAALLGVGRDQLDPRGLFWAREADGYLGIDNLAGEAFVETFGTLEACRRWLNREEA